MGLSEVLSEFSPEVCYSPTMTPEGEQSRCGYCPGCILDRVRAYLSERGTVLTVEGGVLVEKRLEAAKLVKLAGNTFDEPGETLYRLLDVEGET